MSAPTTVSDSSTASQTSRPYTPFSISELAEKKAGTSIEICAFVSSIRAVGKKKVFLTLRQGSSTIQVIATENTKVLPASPSAQPTAIQSITPESYLVIQGELQPSRTPVASCTIKEKEVSANSVTLVTEAQELPFQIKDTEWTQQQRATTKELPKVIQAKRLDWRYIDLRSAETRSIFQIYSTLLNAFREYFQEHKYVEIRTPKLLGTSSEGGADVFQVQYFSGTATLAQSPQLYKQMAIIGGFERVFEIGPCFRAENSNTGRHLTEFTGVDLEMELKNRTYIDLVRELYGMLRDVIGKTVCGSALELQTIARITGQPQVLDIPEEPVIVSFAEAVQVLASLGREADPNRDIGTEDEKVLGKYMKEHRHTDLFAITAYPASARPFYTSLCPNDPERTQSFDFILCGEEISSGAERVHKRAVLEERIASKGIQLDSIRDYIEAFSYGVPRHGGCGIGLERIVKLVTQTGDIHKCSMFPRDPSRLRP